MRKLFFLVLMFMVFTCQIDKDYKLILTPVGAQYVDFIDHYNIHFYLLDEGQSASIDTTLSGELHEYVIKWTRGNASTPEYFTSYSGTYTDVLNVDNTPSLWDGSTASAIDTLTLVEGVYEMTIREVNTYGESSGFSQPFTFQMQDQSARVVIIIGVK